MNSVLTHASAKRIAVREEVETITDFYFTTAGSGFDQLTSQESRWLLPQREYPPAVQALLRPLNENPALIAALFSTEVLFTDRGKLWRVVPNRPGSVLEGDFTDADAEKLDAGLFQTDTETFRPVIFLVNHLGRSSYLTGDRSFRNSTLASGMLLGVAWEQARAAQLPIATANTFIDASVNEALRCDGVERAVMAVILLPASSDSDDSSRAGGEPHDH
ncbi:hypothetical protein [Brevibacterium atlanticum]|uniref:hypothetical protein n=1 Tax=Brevibacterium atlanticum TaxID=2697563 RepID=UPI00141F706E|nr:hypothetical protein [Brevibacterium atlanticum]